MGFTDKMCYEVARDIINKFFWINYEPTIDNTKPWYENLNQFIVKEWDRFQKSEDNDDQFTREEEEMIVSDALQMLLDKIEIDEDEFEEFHDEVDWFRFDDIIGHYSCIINKSSETDNVCSHTT